MIDAIMFASSCVAWCSVWRHALFYDKTGFPGKKYLVVSRVNFWLFAIFVRYQCRFYEYSHRNKREKQPGVQGLLREEFFFRGAVCR